MARRLVRARGADQISHLHDGRLAASGAPSELLVGRGPTAVLFKLPLAARAHAS